MNNTNNINTRFIIERHFGTLDLMDLYTDYAVDKIIEAEKQGSASDNAA